MSAIGLATECPKCSTKAADGLFRFCTHAVCPVREWERERNPPAPQAQRQAMDAGINTEAAAVWLDTVERQRAVIAELLAALRFIADRESLMFAECSDAEAIIARAREAIAKATP